MRIIKFLSLLYTKHTHAHQFTFNGCKSNTIWNIISFSYSFNFSVSFNAFWPFRFQFPFSLFLLNNNFCILILWYGSYFFSFFLNFHMFVWKFWSFLSHELKGDWEKKVSKQITKSIFILVNVAQNS